jgi:hypothetical protein
VVVMVGGGDAYPSLTPPLFSNRIIY